MKEGVVSGGGKSLSYGELVKNQKLNLTIPVKGDVTIMSGLTVAGEPPLKPLSQYFFLGKSFPNSTVVSKVAAKETWATDVRLPGLLMAVWCIRKRWAPTRFRSAIWTRLAFRARRLS